MSIRQWDPTQDLLQIYELFCRNNFFDKPLSFDEFKTTMLWLYFSTGKAFALVYEVKGQIVGHYGQTPIRYRLEKKLARGGLGSNLIIDEKWRSQGIFVPLQRHFLTRFSQSDINFTYALVNRPHVLSLHLKTGYAWVGEVPVYLKILKFKSFFEILAPAWLPSPVKKIGAQALNAIDGIWKWFRSKKRVAPLQLVGLDDLGVLAGDLDRMLSDFDSYAARDSEALRWRWFGNSVKPYQVFGIKGPGERFKGYLACRVTRMRGAKILALADLVYDPRDFQSGAELLRIAARVADEEDVDGIAAIFNPHTHLLSLFRRSGFFKGPEGFHLVVNKDLATRWESVDTVFKKWYVTWFDHDVV